MERGRAQRVSGIKAAIVVEEVAMWPSGAMLKEREGHWPVGPLLSPTPPLQPPSSVAHNSCSG